MPIHIHESKIHHSRDVNESITSILLHASVPWQRVVSECYSSEFIRNGSLCYLFSQVVQFMATMR